MPDHYATLGINRDATPEQVRAAFRALAFAHHPDRATAPESAARFKAASEAYEVLSSPARRAAYDQSLDTPWTSLDLGPFADLFRPFYEAAPSAPRYSLGLPLREAASGGKRSISLPAGGSVTLDIPPGVEDGTWLRAGGVEVEINVLPDPAFARSHQDLFSTAVLPLAIALNGGSLTVPTLRGAAELSVPPGTQSLARFRLRGQGMPNPQGGPPGDLYVQVILRLPALDPALRRWAARMPGFAKPAKARSKT